MKTVGITVKEPHDLQADILTDKTRFRVLCIGRRWGKTETLILAMVHRLVDGQRLWFCSPTHQNNKRVFPKVKQALKGVPKLYVNNSDLIISLPDGGHLQFVSLHEPDNLRGEGLDHIFIDEAAFIKNGIWDEILRPMLATTGGGATFSSSPNGTGNDFHTLYLRGLDPQQPNWKTFHAPSSTSPLIPGSELEDIKRHTPERVYLQEYEAIFLDDGGAVFRNLEACISDPPTVYKRVCFGVDWGRTNDYTVIVALDMDSGKMLEMQRFNQIDWTLQRDRLITMYTRYKPVVILAESNSIGAPNIEELQKRGLPVTPFATTAQSKKDLINTLALNLEQETVGILNDPILLGELKAYTVEALPSGNFRYNAPAGLHDDCVIALALANYAYHTGRGSLLIDY